MVSTICRLGRLFHGKQLQECWGAQNQPHRPWLVPWQTLFQMIDVMDKAELRRALMALDLPSSGKVESLRERLKDAQKQENRV